MKKNKMKKFNKAGYTLVELMVVVAIIAIFTGLSAVGLNVIKNRNINKYARMVNEVVSDFYKNATTKEGEWKMEVKKVDQKTYRFGQYYWKVDHWEEYYTQSINGTTVYAVKYIELDDCSCTFYSDKTEVAFKSENGNAICLYISRERAVFDKAQSDFDRMVFSNGVKTSEVNIILGTPNNYVGPKR